MIPVSRYPKYKGKHIRVHTSGYIFEGELKEIHGMPEYIVIQKVVGLTVTNVDIDMKSITAIVEEGQKDEVTVD